MGETLDEYKAAREPLPETIRRWHLYGSGMDALEEVSLPLPHYGPDELLVRHDACGICASDIKIITLGPEHPKLIGRDFQAQPVVLGHEVTLTVVGVGEALQDQFAVGQRFIVQADIYNKGVSTAYGYTLDGGFAQYGVLTQQLLNGDDGCYLIPVQEETGYAEAALVEPWACVVAAYAYPNYREGLLDGGRLLIVYVNGALYGDQVKGLYAPGHQPASVVTIDNVPDTDFSQVRAEETGSRGFDDIVVYGTPTARDMGRIMTALGPKGVLNFVYDRPLDGPVPVDVGRIHYEQQLFIGTNDPAKAAEAYTHNTRTDVQPGGRVWLMGAGGPMGQMHVQRLSRMENPPSRIVVSDNHDDRLARIQERFGPALAARGIELILINQKTGGDAGPHGPFDDIVSMVAKADAIEASVPHLAPDGVYNVFAGLAKGVTAALDLGTLIARNQRLVGTSGSALRDMQRTLELVEDDVLSTNASLVAIGGLNALRDGLAGVKAGRYPGKIVIFPQIEDLPLLPVEEMPARLPNVYAKLEDGRFWTKEAEEEFLREYLPRPAGH